MTVDILAEADPPDGYTLFLPFDRPAERIVVDGAVQAPAGNLSRGVHLPPGSRRFTVLLPR